MASLWELWFGITVIIVMQHSTNEGSHGLSMCARSPHFLKGPEAIGAHPLSLISLES